MQVLRTMPLTNASKLFITLLSVTHDKNNSFDEGYERLFP